MSQYIISRLITVNASTVDQRDFGSVAKHKRSLKVLISNAVRIKAAGLGHVRLEGYRPKVTDDGLRPVCYDSADETGYAH